MGSKKKLELSVGGGDGDDEPDVDGNDVSGDEVEPVGAVGYAVRVYVAFVALVVLAAGALNLDTKDASVALDHEVVGGGVSPGLGDHEAVLGGTGHEAHFGPLAAQFAVFDLAALVEVFHIVEAATNKKRGPGGTALRLF